MNLFDMTEPSLPFKIPNLEGFGWEYNKDKKAYFIHVPDGTLIYAEQFFDTPISDSCLAYFLENETIDWKHAEWRDYDKMDLREMKFRNINWRHDTIRMYGKEVYLPRYAAWYGDSDKSYTYSGLTLRPNAWNKGLLYIKSAIEKLSNGSYNSVLMNWYRDGADYINWHADNEKELGTHPVIASVNFGATRRFLLRRNDDNAIKIEFPLRHGTVLIMSGALQHHWQHSVPKERKVKENRVNLTFRTIQ